MSFVLSLQAMIPPSKRFDIFLPVWDAQKVWMGSDFSLNTIHQTVLQSVELYWNRTYMQEPQWHALYHRRAIVQMVVVVCCFLHINRSGLNHTQ